MSQALFDAVKSGNLSQLNSILQGANVNVAGEGGMTPLMLAASLGHLETVKALLGAGAEVAARGAREYNALMYATYNSELDRGFPEVVQVLIDAGADIETQIFYAIRPLMLAAGAGETAVCQVLLKAGADPKARNEGGRTALMMVKDKDYIDVINLLHEAESMVELGADGAGCGSRNAPNSNVVTFLKKEKH